MISKICDDVYKEFSLGKKSNKQKMAEKIHQLGIFFFHGGPITIYSLEALFDLERKLIHSRGPNKNTIESTILKGLIRHTFLN